MTATTTYFPGTATLLADAGANWTNVNNIKVAGDGNAATGSGSSGTPITKTLRARNFGIPSTDLPSGATVVGIEVAIGRVANASGDTDSVISLCINSAGTVADEVGSNKATGTSWPTGASFITATYGGPTDMWGTSLTDAQIRAATFGVDIKVAGASTSRIDFITVKVYYTTGGVAGFTQAIIIG